MKEKVKNISEDLSVQHPIIVKKIKKSLDHSVQEGCYASAMTGFGTSYMTPYALALNASDGSIGLLNGFVSLLPSILQLKTTKLVEKNSRKKIALVGTLIQAIIFVPLILTALLFLYNVPGTVWIAIVLIILFYIVGAIIHPSWFSWMGSLVPEKERGKYFARRNRTAGFFGLVTMVLGAFILDFAKRWGIVLVGFGLLFSLAFIFRLLSRKELKKQYEPRLRIKKKDYFSFFHFLKKSPKTPFGRFSIYTSIMKFAANIASPFFAVYLLRDLNFSYVIFMMIVTSSSLFQLVFYPLMGKFSDSFGNIKLLKISSVLISILPLLYILSKSPIYLIFIPGIIGGFAWSGFNLATNNYVYDSVRQTKRAYGLTYFNLLTGIGLFIGAGVGSLITLYSFSFINTVIFIFIISSIARFMVFLIGYKHLKEVRHVEHFSNNYIIKEFNPAVGIVREMHHFKHIEEEIVHHI